MLLGAHDWLLQSNYLSIENIYLAPSPQRSDSLLASAELAKPSPSRRTGPSSRSCSWCTSAGA